VGVLQIRFIVYFLSNICNVDYTHIHSVLVSRNIMPKFTLFFKDKPLQTYTFGMGVIYIGRDDTNNIVIDSLAVAPIHAVVNLRASDCLIKQVSSDFPLIINDQLCLEYHLNDNDRISIGKHTLLFGNVILQQSVAENVNNMTALLSTQEEFKEANLQVMDCKYIGRIIPIKKAVTRMGKSGEGVVVITKRKEGYFISALESHISLTVNKHTLNDQIIQLAHEDLIRIDNVSMQFFLA
jgi:hypothetical protein